MYHQTGGCPDWNQDLFIITWINLMLWHLKKKALFYSNWALLRTELRMYCILTEFELMYSKMQKKKRVYI